MDYIKPKDTITVEELTKKVKKKGIYLNVIPYDYIKTKGKLFTPFCLLPKELRDLSGNKFKLVLKSFIVKQYALEEVSDSWLFDLNLNFKKREKEQILYVWI